MLAAIAAAFLLSYRSKPAVDATKAAGTAVATGATDVVKAVAAAIPAGAGSIAEMFEGAPSLKVYFDTGKTDLAADFQGNIKPIVDHLKANASMKAVVPGFNDPTGNAAGRRMDSPGVPAWPRPSTRTSFRSTRSAI